MAQPNLGLIAYIQMYHMRATSLPSSRPEPSPDTAAESNIISCSCRIVGALRVWIPRHRRRHCASKYPPTAGDTDTGRVNEVVVRRDIAWKLMPPSGIPVIHY